MSTKSIKLGIQLIKTALILLLIAWTNQMQQALKVTTFPIHTLSKSAPSLEKNLPGISSAPQSIKESHHHTGSLTMTLEDKKNQIWISLYHRPETAQEIGVTKMMIFSLPFWNTDDLKNQTLTYSEDSKDPRYRFDQTGFMHSEIDHELSLFPSEAPIASFKAIKVLIKADFESLVDAEGSPYFRPNLDFLEVFYTENNTEHHLRVTGATLRHKELPTWLISVTLAVVVLVTFIAPIYLSYQFRAIFEEFDGSQVFLATQIYDVTFPVSALILLKFFHDLQAFLVVFLIASALSCAKLYGIYSCVLSFKKLQIEAKTVFFLGLVAILHVCWITLLFWDFKQIFRTGVFYSILGLLDLAFGHFSRRLKYKIGFFRAWLLVMLPSAVNQVPLYWGYCFGYWYTHAEIPWRIVVWFIAPASGVLGFMLLMFYVRFTMDCTSRQQNEGRKTWNGASTVSSGVSFAKKSEIGENRKKVRFDKFWREKWSMEDGEVNNGRSHKGLGRGGAMRRKRVIMGKILEMTDFQLKWPENVAELIRKGKGSRSSIIKSDKVLSRPRTPHRSPKKNVLTVNSDLP